MNISITIRFVTAPRYKLEYIEEFNKALEDVEKIKKADEMFREEQRRRARQVQAIARQKRER